MPAARASAHVMASIDNRGPFFAASCIPESSSGIRESHAEEDVPLDAFAVPLVRCGRTSGNCDGTDEDIAPDQGHRKTRRSEGHAYTSTNGSVRAHPQGLLRALCVVAMLLVPVLMLLVAVQSIHWMQSVHSTLAATAARNAATAFALSPKLAPGLTGATCDKMLRDPTSLLRRMWAADAWAKMQPGGSACWDVVRDGGGRHTQTPGHFFSETLKGAACKSNWFEGNVGRLGNVGQPPKFAEDAAALVGFDESIDAYCAAEVGKLDKYLRLRHAERCVKANLNILSLFGSRVPYNVCRNLEWQTCAAQGRLPGQGSAGIRFAKAPRTLDATGSSGKPLDGCCGWLPNSTLPPWSTAHRQHAYGFATDDVFFLEVCVFNQVCRNREDLFTLNAGDTFHCDFSEEYFHDLQGILLSPWSEPKEAMQCTRKAIHKMHAHNLCTRRGRLGTRRDDGGSDGGADDGTPGTAFCSCTDKESGRSDDGKPSCSMCWDAATLDADGKAPGDCSGVVGCNHQLYSFCHST